MPLGFCYNVTRKAITPHSGFVKRLYEHTQAPNADGTYSTDLNPIEEMLIGFYRDGDKFRATCLLMALSKTDEELAEIMAEAEIRVFK